MSINNLKTRLNYYGGANQQGRMNVDKLRSLKRAMLYSYQGATVILEDGREFRCLINPDKLKNDYDDKIISIPFEDICLNQDRVGTTTQGIQPIGMKPGDIFEWKENKSHWIVYLQRLEETAYFRAEIRRCRYEIDLNGRKQWAYVRGPQERTIDWIESNGIVKNRLNYTLVMTIPASEENLEFFHRFTKIKIKGKPYEVQVADSISGEGIIDLYLKEYFSNSIQEAADKEKEESMPEAVQPDSGSPHILGENQVYPFDIKEYSVVNAENGTWLLSNKKAKIISQDSLKVTIEVTTGKSGEFDLIYRVNGEDIIVMPITVLSL